MYDLSCITFMYNKFSWVLVLLFSTELLLNTIFHYRSSLFCGFFFWAGIVGEVDEGGDGHYIWTHKKFDIGYNGPYIVDVNLTSESKVKLKPGIRIPFTYEVKFYSIYLVYYLKHQKLRMVVLYWVQCHEKIGGKL